MELSAQKAVSFLQEQYGRHLVAGEAEGRRMMVEALAEGFEIDEDDADAFIGDLKDAGVIQYVDVGGPVGTVPQATMPFAEALGGENPAGPATSAEVPINASYWALGRE